MKNSFIISLGGSLIVPSGGIDTEYLKSFRRFIIKHCKEGRKFFIVAGGGATARQYIDSAKKICKLEADDCDWLGIHSSRLNAHLIKTVLRDIAHPEIIKNPTIRLNGSEPVFVAGGWKPGWSTDYVATMIAQEYEISTVINLSNITHAYDADPAKHASAKPIIETDWSSFRKLVGDKWVPGMNAPFDPIASAKADKLDLKVVIMSKDLKNLRNFINGRPYIGTTINKKK